LFKLNCNRSVVSIDPTRIHKLISDSHVMHHSLLNHNHGEHHLYLAPYLARSVMRSRTRRRAPIHQCCLLPFLSFCLEETQFSDRRCLERLHALEQNRRMQTARCYIVPLESDLADIRQNPLVTCLLIMETSTPFSRNLNITTSPRRTRFGVGYNSHGTNRGEGWLSTVLVPQTVAILYAST